MKKSSVLNLRLMVGIAWYVVSKTEDLEEKITELKKIHFSKTKNLREELKQFVLFTVEKKDLDLIVTYNAYKESGAPSSNLQKII